MWSCLVLGCRRSVRSQGGLLIGRIAVVATPQVSFAWSGFNNAMVSNFGMVLRNIYSKKFLGQLKVAPGRG